MWLCVGEGYQVLTSPSVYKNNIGLFNVIYTDKCNSLSKCIKHYIIYATVFVGGEWVLNNNYYYIVLLVDYMAFTKYSKRLTLLFYLKYYKSIKN